ncbi:MAG TPA: hypothetical protein VKV17_20710 [Bryobacteraceae bacterium]|nr:hypothetical protein [Bryobacteraceae bacterium]
MALFIDGSISGLDDLAAQDSQLLDIASQESINVTQKMALAQETIGLDLLSMLRGGESLSWPLWMIKEPRLDQVAVTPALKLWHTYLTLELVYRDAYSDQLNDRYGAKRDQFHLLAESARERLIELGLGIVADPVRQAATPQLIAVPGNLPDGTYYATMSWLDQNGQEGASAVPEAITTSASSFEVQPGNAPPNAAGWNVYVGTAPQSMYLQNTTLLAAGAVWLQPDVLTIGGAMPGTGQPPTCHKAVPRLLQRG